MGSLRAHPSHHAFILWTIYQVPSEPCSQIPVGRTSTSIRNDEGSPGEAWLLPPSSRPSAGAQIQGREYGRSF